MKFGQLVDKFYSRYNTTTSHCITHKLGLLTAGTRKSYNDVYKKLSEKENMLNIVTFHDHAVYTAQNFKP